jgi:hypothetical protein
MGQTGETRVKSSSGFRITPPALISFKRREAAEDRADPVAEGGKAVLVEKEVPVGRERIALVTREVLAKVVTAVQVVQAAKVVQAATAAVEETVVTVPTLP